MAISIDWGNRVIYVPKDFMTLIQSTPTEIRELNLNTFRLALKDLEDSEEGMCFPDTHRHNTEVTVAGMTLARVIEIINDYTVTFEDGQYAVNLPGANSNVGDVVNVNQVSVRTFNSAGLIVHSVGSGLSTEEHDKLMVLPELDEIPPVVRTELATELAEISKIKAFIANRLRINKETGAWTVYAVDKVTPLYTGMLDGDGVFGDRVPT